MNYIDAIFDTVTEVVGGIGNRLVDRCLLPKEEYETKYRIVRDDREYFDQPESFRWSGISGPEKYDTRNMLMQKVNFPAYFYPEDKIMTIWSDRKQEKWETTMLKMFDTLKNDGLFHEISKDQLLAFAQEMTGQTFPLTGAMVIRYSKNGYPIYELVVIQEVRKAGRRRPSLSVRYRESYRQTYI